MQSAGQVTSNPSSIYPTSLALSTGRKLRESLRQAKCIQNNIVLPLLLIDGLLGDFHQQKCRRRKTRACDYRNSNHFRSVIVRHFHWPRRSQSLKPPRRSGQRGARLMKCGSAIEFHNTILAAGSIDVKSAGRKGDWR